MTSLPTVTFKILKPLMLAIGMLWLTPLFGMMHAHPTMLVSTVTVENQSVVYKSANTSVQFKS